MVNYQSAVLDRTFAALADPTVQKFIAGKPIRKIVFVPGKLVNVVV